MLKFVEEAASPDPHRAAAACRQLRSQAQASGHHSKWTGPAAAAAVEEARRNGGSDCGDCCEPLSSYSEPPLPPSGVEVRANEDDPLMSSYYPKQPAWLSTITSPRRIANAAPAAPPAQASSRSHRGTSSGGGGGGSSVSGGHPMERETATAPRLAAAGSGEGRRWKPQRL